MHMSACLHVHVWCVCVSVSMGTMFVEARRNIPPPEIGVTGGCELWLLGTKLETSGRAASALKHRHSPAPVLEETRGLLSLKRRNSDREKHLAIDNCSFTQNLGVSIRIVYPDMLIILLCD
ncbi:rCG62758 [Rattus norvegicus]|uniref:RCG62758 n=1 Tax=Rattus norvegicus TaxID=10116 RepID=A6J6H6_RAT|nr:rCG62758 [Rattus norvegicus]